MRSNYHKIKAIVNNIHNYSEIIHGATESIQSIFKTNVIYIKNTIVSKLHIKSNIDNNVIKITNKALDASLEINSKLDDNHIFVKNEIDNKLLSQIITNASNIKIVNSFLLYIAKIINISNDVNIKNRIHHILKIGFKPNNDPDIIIEDSINSHVNIALDNSQNKNNITVNQPEVNADAWFFVRLEAMSGGLNSYYNQTINDTGRKKVV